jgi:hypothetical protein
VTPQRRYAITVAVFATVLYLALAICVSGLISLFANREVLAEGDAGPLVAPIMFAVSTAAVFVQLVRLGVGPRRRSTIGAALIAGIAVYLLFVVVGSILYAAGNGDPLRALFFISANAAGPYAISIAVLATVVVLAYLLLLTYRESGGAKRTPRWPWEKKDDRDREDRD